MRFCSGTGMCVTGKNPLPDVSRLRALFWYDANTGELIRRAPAGRWGRIPIGTVAGVIRPDGYFVVDVDGTKLLVHRVAFAIAHGQWPIGQIDHIDGNPSNNRLLNLRDVEPATNSENQRRARGSTKSGLLGVRPMRSRWAAAIKVGGVRHHLGTFDTPELASAAYVAAKRVMHLGNTL